MEAESQQPKPTTNKYLKLYTDCRLPSNPHPLILVLLRLPPKFKPSPSRQIKNPPLNPSTITRHRLCGRRRHPCLHSLAYKLHAARIHSSVLLLDREAEAIQKEAKNFTSGETSHYMVLIWSAIFPEFLILGIAGVIHYTPALLSGIILAVLVPVIEILAVIFFNESFNGGKGVALALSRWGFVSYF